MRAEDAGRDARYRERFDCAFSRAVAALPALLELTAPFVRVGGKLIAYKGDAAGELTAAEHAAALLGVRLSSADVTGGYGKRTLVFGEKQRHTPAAYPRKAGMPAKSPL